MDALKFLEEIEIARFKWLTCSLDLNPTDYVWHSQVDTSKLVLP